MTNPFFAESTPTRLEQLPGSPMRPAAMIRRPDGVALRSAAPGRGSRDPRRGDSPGAGRETEGARAATAERRRAPDRPARGLGSDRRAHRGACIRGSARSIPAAASRPAPACESPSATTARSTSSAGTRSPRSRARRPIWRCRPSRDHARVTLSGRYIDAPDVRYFGVGNSSSKEDLTRFGYTPKGGGARLDIDGGKYFSLGGGVNYIDIETSGGRDHALHRGAVHTGEHARARHLQIHLHQQHGSSGLRLAAAARLLGPWRAVPRAVRRLPGARQRPVLLQVGRSGGAAAHPDPARELGDRASRPRNGDRHRTTRASCRTSCCRRSAAAPRSGAIRTSDSAIAIGC